MVWPHRQLPALAGGEQATSRQNELPSPTQLSERSRELRPHRPRNLRRSARIPKLQQCTLDAGRFVGDQGEGGSRTTLRTREVEETALRQCQAPSTPEIPPAVHHSLTWVTIRHLRYITLTTAGSNLTHITTTTTLSTFTKYFPTIIKKTILRSSLSWDHCYGVERRGGGGAGLGGGTTS